MTGPDSSSSSSEKTTISIRILNIIIWIFSIVFGLLQPFIRSAFANNSFDIGNAFCDLFTNHLDIAFVFSASALVVCVGNIYINLNRNQTVTIGGFKVFITVSLLVDIILLLFAAMLYIAFVLLGSMVEGGSFLLFNWIVIGVTLLEFLFIMCVKN